MQRLLMVVLLGASAVVASAQSLQPRRLFGSRLARPRQPVSQTADPEKAQAEQEEQQREAEREEQRRQILAMQEELKRTREAKGAADNGSSLRTCVQTSDSIQSRRRRKAVFAAGKGADSATNKMSALRRQRLTGSSNGVRKSEIVNGVTWYYATFANGDRTCARIMPGPVKYAGELAIPASLGGCPVTDIDGDFATEEFVKGRTYVRNGRCGAFFKCSGLKSVLIPACVTNIGPRAFEECEKLVSISVDPANPVYSSREGFLCSKNGSRLIAGVCGDVTVPKCVTEIGHYAFYHYSGLTSVTLLSGVTNVGWHVFSDCNRLKAVTIPSSVKSIAEDAFSGTPFFDGLPDGMVILGGSVLYKYKGSPPSSVTIPSYVTSITHGAFDDCAGLESIDVPRDNPAYCSVDGVLYDKMLRELVCCPWGKRGVVTIPSGVTNISRFAYWACKNLEAIDVAHDNPTWSSFGGVLYDKMQTKVICCPRRKDGAVRIPPGVTHVCRSAFSGCCKLTSITIPQSVTNIENSAFFGCCGLTALTIPSDVAHIGWGAFYGCTNVTSITLPANVTMIKDHFPGAKNSITNVTFSGEVTRIGNRFFEECRELKSATIPSGVTSIGGGAFLGCGGLESVSIPASVTNIGGAVFRYCRGLKSIRIPPRVKDIGEVTFAECSGLELVSLPSNMTSIGRGAFYKCGKLKSVTIPVGVTRIEESTFEGCNGLVSVSIPSTVTSIGEKAFTGCGGLMSFSVDPDNPAFSSRNGMLCSKDGRFLIAGVNGDVTIPSSVTSIESRAFECHDGLKSLVIPSSVTCIMDGAFAGCRGLESVTIPTNVVSVGNHAFYDCRGLHSVAILSGETRIWERAFGDCCEIRSVATPLSIYARLPYCFMDSLHAIAHITIVDGVERVYEAAFEGCSGLKSVTIPASVKSIDANAFSNCSKLKSVNVIKDGMIKSMSIEDFRNQLNR